MRTKLTSAAIAALVFLAGSHAAAQGDFQWQGQLTSGQAIEIKGVNGDIRATASSSGQVEVIAVRTARRGNPADVS